jgi:hypothetical protein
MSACSQKPGRTAVSPTSRLELFTAAFVNSYKDRYEQVRGSYEAEKQLWSKTVFFPVDFFPMGSTLATLGNNKLVQWADQSEYKFIKSDLFKNWLNQGNSGAVTKSFSDYLSGHLAGAAPKFEPAETLNLASDVMLNLDLDIETLRRDPSAFNQLYGLPSVNPRTGERYEAVTADQARQLLNWIDSARFAPDDPAFSSLYTETKQLLSF